MKVQAKQARRPRSEANVISFSRVGSTSNFLVDVALTHIHVTKIQQKLMLNLNLRQSYQIGFIIK